ncbi:MAG: AAA family ATPase [Flavobacteriaceae bacterium]
MQKIDTDNSVLKGLNKALKRYKSEYIYLFSLIYKYKQEIENGGEVYDILIPNALRRFLEIYTLMKIPNEPDSVENKIVQLVDNVNNFKTLNHFSHFTSFEKATRHDELIMVLPTACNELFELLKLDEKHFESLKKAI